MLWLGRGGGLVLWVVVSCTTVLASAQAPADGAAEASDAETERRDREARSLFEAGRLAAADGRYEEALKNFRRSHELSGRAALLYNVGNMAERLRRSEEALEAYERYLEAEPGAPNRKEVERRIEILRQDVAARAVVAEDAAAADAADVTSGPSTREHDEPLYKKWWLWTAVGAVVAGGVITAVVLGASGGRQDPIPGRDGVVVTTLAEAP